MNKDVIILREAIAKVVHMLAQVTGLTVTQRGSQAYVQTDPKTLKPRLVNIPFIPDDASEDLIAAIQGFLDHEVAHILFTEWKAVKDAYADGQELATLHNMVEDTYIEREMARRFPGCGHNLSVLHDFFIRKITTPALDKIEEEIAAGRLPAAKRDEMRFNVIAVPLCRAWAGQHVFADWLKDSGADQNPFIKKLAASMPKNVLARIPKIKDSYEALEIARIIKAILNPPPPPAPVQPPQQAKCDEKSENGPGKPQKGEKQDKSEPQDAESGEQGEPGEGGESGKSDSKGEGKKPHENESKNADGDKDCGDDNDAQNESGEGDGESGETESETGKKAGKSKKSKEKKKDAQGTDEHGADRPDGAEAAGEDDRGADGGADAGEGEDDPQGASGEPSEAGSEDDGGDGDHDDDADGSSGDPEGDQGDAAEAAGGDQAGDDADEPGSDESDGGASGEDQPGEGEAGREDERMEPDGASDGSADADQPDDGGGAGGEDGDGEAGPGEAGEGEGDLEGEGPEGDEGSSAEGSEGGGDGGAERAEGKPGGEEEGGGTEGGSEEGAGQEGRDEKPRQPRAKAGGKEADGGEGSGDLDVDDAASGGGEDSDTGQNQPGIGVSFAKIEAKPYDFDSLVRQHITDEAIRQTRDADYSIYSTEFDIIGKHELSAGFSPHQFSAMDDQVRGMVGVMQKEIERMMAQKNRVLNVGGQKRGKLNAPGLYRIIGNDPRVFKRKEEHHSTDTAVSLVCDNSGSMSGDRCRVAMSAAYALAATLERVNLAHEVIGFTTDGHGKPGAGFDSYRIDAEGRRLGISYSRILPMRLTIFKDFTERLTPPVRQRFADMAYNQPNMGANVDGESVQFALNRILKRKEQRKVMLVLSDGFPAGGDHAAINSHLHRVVEDAKKAKVEIIGIGIQSNAVKTFYPKAIVLNSVEELPKMVMGELRRILLAA